jgi:hypothetical protein
MSKGRRAGGVRARRLGAGVRHTAARGRCQARVGVKHTAVVRVWGVAEDRRRRAGDRGAHHKGACVPTSV